MIIIFLLYKREKLRSTNLVPIIVYIVRTSMTMIHGVAEYFIANPAGGDALQCDKSS